jgi:Bacterial PH domain
MTPESDPSVCAFGPSRRFTWALAAAAVLAGGDAIITTHPATRLVLAVAAVVLAVIAGSDLIFSPRLVAGPVGLTIRSPGLRAQLAWSDIDVIHIDQHSHLGLTGRALEIEAGPTLVIFGRWGLGCDPRLAIDALYRCADRAGRADLEDDRAPDDERQQDDGDTGQPR